MNVLLEYVRLILREVKSSELPWSGLTDTLRKKFPNVGDIVSQQAGDIQPFELKKGSITDRGRMRKASFMLGYGEYDIKNSPTKISDRVLDDIIDEIDRWAKHFGLHVARDRFNTSGNRAYLEIGLMDIETQEVEKPKKLYHITDPKSARIILRQGLLPRGAKRRGRGKGNAVGRSYPARIFMFTDYQEAKNRASKDAKIAHRLSFFRDVLGDEKEYETGISQTISKTPTPVILEIEGSAVNRVMSDPDFQTGAGAVFTTDPIPPNAISVKDNIDRGDYNYDWRGNYRVEELMKADPGGTTKKINTWKLKQGI